MLEIEYGRLTRAEICHTALAEGQLRGLELQTFSLRTRGSRSIPSLERLQPNAVRD